jgi:hypothetical protein
MKLKGARLARGQSFPRTASAFYYLCEILPLQRLYEIAVATGFEHRVAFDIVGAAGHDDDPGRIKFFANRTADLQAADSRQQQIAQDHFRTSLNGNVDSGRAVVRLDYFPAMAREKARDALSAFRITFNE